jgi:hypothetical protein
MGYGRDRFLGSDSIDAIFFFFFFFNFKIGGKDEVFQTVGVEWLLCFQFTQRLRLGTGRQF